MPRFEYKAKDGPEKVTQGVIVAGSYAEAMRVLEGRGLSPVWVRPASRTAGDARAHRRVKARDVTILTRQMAGLLRAGIPILRTLSTLQEQCENSHLAAVLAAIEADIREGNTLSASLARHDRIFPPLYINMVRAGESAGRLDTVLERLSAARETDEESRRRIQAAVAYPLLILLVGVITVFVLLVFFLPRVAGLFRSVADLPFPTRVMLAVSSIVSRYWMWIFFVVGMVLAVIRRVASTTAGRIGLDRWKMSIPLLGRLWVETDISRFARTFAMLLDAGVSLSSALDLSSLTLDNIALRQDVERIKQSAVRDGLPISAGLKTSGVFPKLVSSIAAVGEESGHLAEAMDEVAGYYEKDVEHRVRTALSLLEPVLILVVGAIVGLIVAAMLLPVFRLGLTM